MVQTANQMLLQTNIMFNQHHLHLGMSRRKLFLMTAAQIIQAVGRRRRRKTKLQLVLIMTQDVHNDDDAENEAPQQQTPKEKPEEMPEETSEQSGAPADDAPADNMILVPLTEEEMVMLTSGDEEPAAQQEENQPPGPVEVFSIDLNGQQTPVSCKWGSFCFTLTTLLLFIYTFGKYYVSFQLLLKFWRTVHQRTAM